MLLSRSLRRYDRSGLLKTGSAVQVFTLSILLLARRRGLLIEKLRLKRGLLEIVDRSHPIHRSNGR